jgi:hypothetical protein
MEEANVRIIWIWIHERGGQDVAQVSVEFPGPTDTDTVSFSVNVPMAALFSVTKFVGVLLKEQLELTGSDSPREIYDCERTGRAIRALENVHQRVWMAMLRAARIHSANAVMANRITRMMCRNPKGDGDAA